jgi:hypothetical protein
MIDDDADKIIINVKNERLKKEIEEIKLRAY